MEKRSPCLSCAAAESVHDIRDIAYTYKGESTMIPAVDGDFCPACGELVLDVAESRRVSAAMLEFNQIVNASMAEPASITMPSVIDT
jgi:HTH-type transcriptional regulator/antitoxin MqsA